MTETFLSPVIEKLLDLIVEEAKSLKGVHRDVESLQKELEIIEPFLRDAEAKSGRGEFNDASKVWLKQLRQQAERIEDVVDEYLYNVQQHRHEGGFVGSLRRAGGSIKSFSWRRNMASEIGAIKESLREIKERGQSYGLIPFEQPGGGSSSSAAAVDPRIGSLFVDDDELVGIDSMSEELVTSLVEGSSVRSVISFVGEGGIGKTTLANKVYKDVVAKGHFDCHVWITVSQSCNVETILKNMTKKICPTTQQPAGGETVAIEALISVLKDSLTTKRYMVVFDDVWQTDFWGVIKHALPNNVNGSRIILTTRNASVVESFKETSDDVVQQLKTWSHQQAWELFCKKAFSCSEIKGCCPPELVQLSHEILSKCQGLPLAIVVVAGLLSKKEKSRVEWQKVLDNLSREFDGNAEFSNVSKVLLLSYHDLPYHLKLCFLYFGIFPEDCSIHAKRLYKLWIAEGFIKSRRDNILLEHSAEEYLNELINRNLVSYEVRFGSDKWCKVHDLFHELILTRIDDCCFCHLFNEIKLKLNGRSRRLSNYGNIKNALNDIRDSKIRSIFLFDVDELTNSLLIGLFENFKLLKVLDFRNVPLHKLPKEVGSLFNLKYLDLRGTRVEMLPKSICKLHNLQTLDVSDTLVRELPIEVNELRNLRHLIAFSIDCGNELSMYTYCGVRIHEGIGRLEDLQTLTCVETYSSGVGFVKELHKLRKLRCLSISKVTAEMVRALGNSIENMNHLDQLYLHAINDDEVLDLDCNISSPPTLLLYLHLYCRLQKIPSWISELQSLQGLQLAFSRLIDEPLEYLKGLPKLAFLRLHQAYDGEELHFKEGSFQKLKQLQLKKLEGLKVLKIDRGALPLLEKLEFGPSPLMMEMPSNIQYLQNLKSLSIFDMPREFVIALQPNGGTDHWKIQHIPIVEFFYYTGRGMRYYAYKLGGSELLQRLEEQANPSAPT